MEDQQETIDQLIEEEAILNDPSYYLWDEIYQFSKYLDEYKVYQVLPIDEVNNLIVGCEMLKENDDYCIKLSCFKDAPGSEKQPEEHVIYLEAINKVLKLIAAKDVIPNDEPLKLIRNFREYVRLFIFSFVVYNPEQSLSEGEESIQIKCSTLGLLSEELHIKFCKKEWSIVFKYIKDYIFRMTFYIVTESKGNLSHGISIDIKCDRTSYPLLFKEIDVDKVIQKHSGLDKDKFVLSHNLLDGTKSLKIFKSGML